jgi:hypothetical protein
VQFCIVGNPSEAGVGSKGISAVPGQALVARVRSRNSEHPAVARFSGSFVQIASQTAARVRSCNFGVVDMAILRRRGDREIHSSRYGSVFLIAVRAAGQG